MRKWKEKKIDIFKILDLEYHLKKIYFTSAIMVNLLAKEEI